MWSLSVEMILSLAVAAALIPAGLAIAWGMRQQRRSIECDAQRMFEQMDLIRAEVMLLSDRIQGLETATPRALERPAPVEVRAPAVASAPAPRGYEVAARLARGGATCEELISSCGLSRHEAELLIRLHKADAARAKTAAATAQVKTDTVKPKPAETPRARFAVVG